MHFVACLWLLVGLMATSQTETIHFTNSPGHLIGSRNFTTYKLLVKDADPITIIEANKNVGGSSVEAVTAITMSANRRGDDDISRETFIETGGGADVMFDSKKSVTIGAHPLAMMVTDDLKTAESTNRDTDGSDNGLKKLVYSPILLKKFVKEYTEKLKNADPITQNAIKEISEKINQNAADSVESAKQDVPEEKYNYNSYDRRRPVSNKPYQDRDGWVTLEAVPWSSSTVSKWHGHHQYDDDRHRPNSYGGSSTFNDRVYSVNSHRPSHHHDEEEFYRPKPYGSRPVDDDRPTYTAWSKPQAFSRPSRPHTYSSFNDRDEYYDRDRPYSSKPWASDIITDSRPSNFPRPHRRPGASYNDAEPYSNDDEERYRPSSGSESQHPANGNGEWVLISTTKGYQVPGRRQSGRRSMKFGVPSAMDTTRDGISTHKSVKLTVLPPLKSNSTFSTDDKQMVLSHGGLLEVVDPHTTIEAAAHAARKQATTKQPSKTSTKATTKRPTTKNTTVKDNKKHKVIRGNRN